MLDADDLQALKLTAQLATLTAALLLLLGTPIAWWLARMRLRLKGAATAVALPSVLPPTVIGFYLLMLMGPHGPLGAFRLAMGCGLLPFTFWGLVVGSVLHSFLFVAQPLQQAFEAIRRRLLELAATLPASSWDYFLTVALPLALYGHAEVMDYGKANVLAGGMVGFGFAVMLLLYLLNRRLLAIQDWVRRHVSFK